ncbi:hemagglutinin repeat-containing protein [Xenorhabdus sp. 18]|nr:hemagglutinin repeat-containing protein [Xenorhabdus sp. 18]
MAQYQTLMNNGTKVANDFRLVPGVALTPAQIAALQQDIVLQSAENTQTTRGENSSKGGSVGVGLTAGQGGYGIKFSASVNKGKGHETGDGVTHSETLIDAGNQVSLKAGQDTTLKGAQVSGEKVTADVGRNLHLQSEQDKDNYDAKQENVSAGASFTYGSMSGSASVNASRDKIHSQYDSVNEQTGIFAGKGGFDIKVGEHTQLDGAVIASTADKDKNRLETGTLGFSDIENKAEYQSEHQSVGISTGGAVGSQLASNMASNMLAGSNKSDSKSSTTHAAVSDGAITIRDADKQQQAVSALSRDTDNAANSLSPIFDKEKEQQRLAQAQAIAQIGTQVLDIYSTHEAIKATKTATEKLKDPQTQQALKQQAEAQLKQENGNITADAIADRAHKIAYDAALKAQGAEIGGGQRQAVTAVVTALQGLAGGDIKAAIAGGAAPYLANAVKDLTYGGKPYEQLTAAEKATNLLAHAILGGVIAEMKGGSATAGAVGAAGGELAASAIAGVLYPDKNLGELSSDEKERVSNLSTLAGGLAAGLATDSTAGGVSGAETAKNAVEGNFLSPETTPKGLMEYGQAQNSLAMQMLKNGATPDELSEALAKQARGTHPEGQDPARGLIVAWGNFFGVPLDVVMSNEQMTPEKAAEIVSSGVPTSEAKVMQYVAAKAFLAVTKGGKAENALPQWGVGEGKYSPKNQGTVTNVEHPTGKFDGKSLPNIDKAGKSEVIVNDLKPHEIKQAQSIVNNFGGTFEGVPKLRVGDKLNGKAITSPDYPVIDGWHTLPSGNKVPISLKELSSSNPLSILQDVSKANKTGKEFNITNSTMYVDAKNMSSEQLVKFASNGPLSGKALEQGVINRVIVRTKEGFVTIESNSVSKGKPKGW